MNYCSKKQGYFYQLLWKSGFTDTSEKGLLSIGNYFERSPRTIRRWINDDCAPNWAIEKLNNRSKLTSDKWNGFHFSHDELVTPNGYRYTPKQLESLSASLDLIKAFYNR